MSAHIFLISFNKLKNDKIRGSAEHFIFFQGV